MDSMVLNKISSYFEKQTAPQRTSTRQNQEYPNLKPLSKDTVSFSSNNTKQKFLKALEELYIPDIQKNLKKTALRIHDFGIKKQAGFKELCSNIFLDVPYSTRIKSPESIECKIQRKCGEVEEFNRSIMNNIQDLAGARGITDGSQAATDTIVENIIKEIQKGTLRITSIKNYSGKCSQPYFSEENIQKLQKANKLAGHNQPIKVLKGDEAVKQNGYTAGHIRAKTKKGLNVEFQIKGQGVDIIDKSTHITHDLSIAKSASHIDSTTKRRLLSPILEAYASLNCQQTKLYEKYLNICYQKARETEVYGKKLALPPLPKDIPHTLSIEKLREIAQLFNLM